MFFCFSNTFDFLVNIEYAKVLKQLCWEIFVHLLGNICSFEALKFLTRSDSVPPFMTQLKLEKADFTKEKT